MQRQSKEAMFEHLLMLRRCYPLRSDYDRRAIMSIAATLDYGEWRLRLARVIELRRGGGMAGRRT